MAPLDILNDRKGQVFTKGEKAFEIKCEKNSLSGSVSQRACVFCGSRVVLYPIADALHLVHGPVGCAAYTWDIRGSMSSGPQLHRYSFTTDLQEKDVIFGGEPKLYKALIDLIDTHKPKAAFIYSTCIIGIIGDDVEAICRKVSKEKGIPVLPVHSEGFKGTKMDGYKAACESLFKLIGTSGSNKKIPNSINILGEFNLAGEAWIIKKYYEQMGVKVISCMTGDGRVDEIRNAHNAELNVVQCSGSMTYLAKQMQDKYDIPFIRVSYFGFDDISSALYDVATYFSDTPEIMESTKDVVREQTLKYYKELQYYKEKLSEKKAAIYVGGAFKAFSLIKILKQLGMQTVLAGSQTGNQNDYQILSEMCDEGTVIVDDSNPVELSKYILEKEADLFIGGVKERPMAFKLGVAFCDHNHERKIPLAGFEGVLNFAREVHNSVNTPIWKFAPRYERSKS